MARLEILEQNDFAPIRSLLNANYGSGFERAVIQAVGGGENYSYKIQHNGGEFYLKLASPRSDARIGMPEQFAQYLGQQGVPAVRFEKMKDGRIAKTLPTDAATLQTMLPGIGSDAEALQKLSGAVLSLSPAMRGTPLPPPHQDESLLRRSASEIGKLAAQVANHTAGFLSSHHLAIDDIPAQKDTPEQTGDKLLKMLHLDAFGTFSEVHHQLHQKNSPASEHMHHHAQIMRENAALMEKMAATHPQGELLRKNAKTLVQFADRYENGLALELLHYANQLIQIKPRLQARENTVCHGDFWHDNFLAENGSISAIIDFDKMQRGDRLQDIVHYTSPLGFDPFLIQQALLGYEQGSGAKLTPEDLSLLPYLKLQDRIGQIPKDLEFAFSRGFPKDAMVRRLTEADVAAANRLEPVEPRVMTGTFDDLKPYIHADYSALMNQPQFDTSLFRRSGRIHAEGGAAVLDYIGAVFSRHDFEAANTARLTEKLDAVIDNEQRLKLFAVNHPERTQYTIDEVVQLYPTIDIAEDARNTRRAALTQEVKAKLEQLPAAPHPDEAMMEKQLAELPPLMQEWLYLKGTEFIFTSGTTTNEKGQRVYKGNEDMFPNHPAVAHMRKGGGNFLTYNPRSKDSITYAYTSMQRDPRVLLAHEAIGHALYNEARQRDPATAHVVTFKAVEAAKADLGDINKTREANPNPNNGRLGELRKAVEQFSDDEGLWNALQKIGGAQVPALEGAARSKWLADVRELTRSSFEKLGPGGWMHNVKMYAERNLFVDEIMAATAEQMFVSGKGRESAMGFVLPALTGFFNTTLMQEMQHFVEEKRGRTTQVQSKLARIESKLENQALRRELVEEAERYRNFGAISFGVAALGVAGAAAAALSGGWILVACCAAISGAGFFSSSQWKKTVNDLRARAAQNMAAPTSANTPAGMTTTEPAQDTAPDKWRHTMTSKSSLDLQQRTI